MAEIIINDVEPRDDYTAAGGEEDFDYNFAIFAEGDIVVLLITSAGVENTLEIGTDYTVAGVGLEDGGCITLDAGVFPTGATAGDRFVLYRDIPNSRVTDFLTGGDFKASTVNRELDKILMMIQQVASQVNRSLGLKKSDEENEITFKVESADIRKDNFLVFGAAGDTVEAGPDSGDISNASANAALAEAALDEFTDIYLGSLAADPTLDNDGDALIEGALYFNSVSNVLKYYTGSTWLSVGANSDEVVKVSANDTTAGYLLAKLVAGSNVSLVEQNDGSNETLEINVATSSFETGDMLPTFKASAKSGWLLMNGGTIGDAASGADLESATYEDLFTHLWDEVGDTYAAVSGGRGASAAADWSAGKTIVVPEMDGRGFLGVGQGSGLSKTWSMGEASGGETKTIAEANLPAHTHAAGTLATSSAGAHTHNLDDSDGDNLYTGASDGSGEVVLNSSVRNSSTSTRLTTESNGSHTHVMSGATGSTGTGNALNVQNPMRAANWQIKI